MAIVSNPLIGKTSGSIGGVTFSSWKGLNVAKSKPTSVANPRTTNQLEQRRMQTFAVALYRQAAALFNIGFIQMAIGQSSYNAFVSANRTNGSITDNGTNADFSHTEFVASKGTLNATTFTLLDVVTLDGDATITWDGAITGNQSATDTVSLIVTNNDGVVLGAQVNISQRSAEIATIQLTVAPVTGQPVHAYAFFYQAGSRKVSDSQHKTTTATV